jgi:glycosyltransferase involved in cell wall biosynthesis
MNMKKKVLLVSYHYPPGPKVGGIRPSKFAQYLPEFGWETTVLTASVSKTAPASEDQTSAIVRVAEWPHPLNVYENLKRRFAKQCGRSHDLELSIHPSYQQNVFPDTRGVAELKRWVLALFWCPDRETGWLIPAIVRGLQIIRQQQTTHVITTGPPFTCHLVGLVLKRMTGVRWIADFRDPWSLQYKVPRHRSSITDVLEAKLIRSVMKAADLVLSVTPVMTEQAIKEHPECGSEKFITLTNGFDPHDFEFSTTLDRGYDGRIVFSYIGSFWGGRTPEPFFSALSDLIKQGRLSRQDIRVNLVGNVAIAEGEFVSDLVSRYGLEDIVSIHPAVPRPEAIKQTLGSDVLLVLTEQQPHALTFKLFDAMASGAMIFNIGSGGAIADVLTKTKRGIAVHYSNVNEIREGILKCIERSRSEEGQRSPEPWNDEAIQEFNIRQLTEKLAGLMEGLNYSLNYK